MPSPVQKDRSTPAGAIRRGRARPTVAKQRPPVAMWGILLVAGGVLAWAAVPRHRSTLPEVWKVSTANVDAQSEMRSQIRELGNGSPPLLRLEWPKHPSAEQYRIRFRGTDGAPGPTPLAIQSPVFLYDLDSDVLRLPREFEWEVTALLADGSEVVSPWRRHPER